jgi:hypothetical protein
VASARGWTVAAWLVGHAQRYNIHAIAFSGQQWSATSGTWQPDLSADTSVRVT